MVSPVPPAVRSRRGRAPGFRRYFSNIRRAVTSTFEGMSVTMSWMFRRPMTIQYPDKIDKPVQEMLPDSYRGVLEVDLDRCTGCLLCAKACPIGCIDISVCKNPVSGARDLEKFDIDIGLCMYCGLCTEACNFDSLLHTSEFEATVSTPEELTLHFVKEPQPVSKQKAGEGTARRQRGSILPGIIPSFGRRKPHQVPPPPVRVGEAPASETPVSRPQSPSVAPPAPAEAAGPKGDGGTAEPNAGTAEPAKEAPRPEAAPDKVPQAEAAPSPAAPEAKP